MELVLECFLRSIPMQLPTDFRLILIEKAICEGIPYGPGRLTSPLLFPFPLFSKKASERTPFPGLGKYRLLLKEDRVCQLMW
jgi:hypothetical protein